MSSNGFGYRTSRLKKVRIDGEVVAIVISKRLFRAEVRRDTLRDLLSMYPMASSLQLGHALRINPVAVRRLLASIGLDTVYEWRHRRGGCKPGRTLQSSFLQRFG